jgi:hypothetical protein
MKTRLVAIAAFIALVASTTASAQHAPAGSQHNHSKPAPAAPAPGQPPTAGTMGGMHWSGMMGGMHGAGMMGGGTCGMMSGMGPMMGGMHMQMMGASADPKTLSRMLRLRGDIMKAVGDVLIKHAQAIESTAGK